MSTFKKNVVIVAIVVLAVIIISYNKIFQILPYMQALVKKCRKNILVIKMSPRQALPLLELERKLYNLIF